MKNITQISTKDKKLIAEINNIGRKILNLLKETYNPYEKH
jgi:hypothetical protein